MNNKVKIAELLKSGWSVVLFIAIIFSTATSYTLLGSRVTNFEKTTIEVKAEMLDKENRLRILEKTAAEQVVLFNEMKKQLDRIESKVK